jgi:hypothetical protein
MKENHKQKDLDIIDDLKMRVEPRPPRPNDPVLSEGERLSMLMTRRERWSDFWWGFRFVWGERLGCLLHRWRRWRERRAYSDAVTELFRAQGYDSPPTRGFWESAAWLLFYAGLVWLLYWFFNFQ